MPESNIQVVWVDLGRCEESDQIVKQGAQNNRRHLEQLEKSPELPLSPLVGELIVVIELLLLLCGVENDDHCVDGQVYLSNDE